MTHKPLKEYYKNKHATQVSRIIWISKKLDGNLFGYVKLGDNEITATCPNQISVVNHIKFVIKNELQVDPDKFHFNVRYRKT